MKKKTAIITSIVGVVAVGSVLAYEFIFKKTPKELYFDTEVKNFQDVSTRFKDDYKDELTYMEKVLKNSYKQNVKLSANVDVKKETVNEKWVELINRASFEGTVQRSVKTHENLQKYQLLLDKKPLVGAELYYSKEKTAFKVPDFYEKYALLENDKFGDLMRKYDKTYNGPDALNLETNYLAAIDVDDEKLEKIKKEYGQFIFDEINEDNVTLEKTTYNKKKAKELTLKLNDKELKKLTKDLLTKLQKDDETLTFFAKEAHDVYFAGTNGFEDGMYEEEFSTKTIKKEMKEEIKQAIKDLDKDPEKVDLKSTIVVIDGKIVDRTIEFSGVNKKTKDGEKMVIKHSIGKENIFSIVGYDIENGKVDKKRSGKIEDVYTVKRDKNGFKNVHTWKVYEEEEKEQYKLVFKHNKNTKNDNYYFTSKVDGIPYQFNIKNNYTVSDKKYDGKTTYEFKVNQMVDVAVDLEEKTTFTDKLSFPKFTKENSVNLHKTSDEELYNIMSEVQTNAQNFMDENYYLFKDLAEEQM